MSATSGAVFFLVVGLVLVALGDAVVANRRGAQDWLLTALERQAQLIGKGSALFWASRRGVKRSGYVLLVLGAAFLIAGFSEL
jgi:hypothetical protein